MIFKTLIEILNPHYNPFLLIFLRFQSLIQFEVKGQLNDLQSSLYRLWKNISLPQKNPSFFSTTARILRFQLPNKWKLLKLR